MSARYLECQSLGKLCLVRAGKLAIPSQWFTAVCHLGHSAGLRGNWGIARLPHGGLPVPLLGLPGLRAEESFVLESCPCAWCALVLLALPLHRTPPPWHWIPVEQCVNSGCTSGRWPGSLPSLPLLPQCLGGISPRPANVLLYQGEGNSILAASG